MIACWSCKEVVYFEHIREADGNCPKCGVEICLEAEIQGLQNELARVKQAVKNVKSRDCGAWLKDCASPMGITCSDGRDNRIFLMNALNDLYKESAV